MKTRTSRSTKTENKCCRSIGRERVPRIHRSQVQRAVYGPVHTLSKTQHQYYVVVFVCVLFVSLAVMTGGQAHLEGFLATCRLGHPRCHGERPTGPLPLPRLRPAVLGCYPHVGQGVPRGKIIFVPENRTINSTRHRREYERTARLSRRRRSLACMPRARGHRSHETQGLCHSFGDVILCTDNAVFFNPSFTVVALLFPSHVHVVIGFVASTDALVFVTWIVALVLYHSTAA